MRKSIFLAAAAMAICSLSAPAGAADAPASPGASVKPLAGTISTEKYGSLGLIQAYRLLPTFVADICPDLAPNTIVYDPTAAQGAILAKLVEDNLKDFTGRLNTLLPLVQQDAVNTAPPAAGHRGNAGQPSIMSVPTVIDPVTTGLQSVIALASLFKVDITGTSTALPADATKSAFITALQQNCNGKKLLTSIGYQGELQSTRYDALNRQLRNLQAVGEQVATATDTVDQNLKAAKTIPRNPRIPSRPKPS